jgi:hypothetical protein
MEIIVKSYSLIVCFRKSTSKANFVNSCAVCGCCTRTDIVREHLGDTLRICDVSAMGLYRKKHKVRTVVQFISQPID